MNPSLVVAQVFQIFEFSEIFIVSTTVLTGDNSSLKILLPVSSHLRYSYLLTSIRIKTMHAAAIEAANTNSVLLTGTIGSGKTYILNKVCGTSFASNMCAESCTREIQEGKACRSGIRVLDTPGFYSTKDSAGHSEKQRTALEQNALSGVYIVVKFGRSDEMAETVNKIMDFVGDDVRIIITHCDFLGQTDSGVDMTQITLRLSHLVDVDLPFILPIGKHTKGHEIEDFFISTLHAPLQHELTELQLASVHDQCVGARRFNKAMQEVHAKIQAASEACRAIPVSKRAAERDAAIWQIGIATKCMVEKEQSRIRQEARELTIEQQYLLDQSMVRAVSLPLEEFLRTIPFTEFHKQSTSSKLEVHIVPDSKSSGWCVLLQSKSQKNSTGRSSGKRTVSWMWLAKKPGQIVEKSPRKVSICWLHFGGPML